MRRLACLITFVAITVAALAGCSSSGSDGAARSDGGKTGSTTTVIAKTGPVPISILVSNDDGYQADGIDTLVEALRKVDGVTVTVVAPLTQQSGQGGKTTAGKLAVTDVKLKSGYAAKAVDGHPADAIRVAVDELGIRPDVVISGINEGQNLGPAVNLSGTVGAARAAAARKIPALATSAGNGAPSDYAASVPFVLDWLDEHRAALSAGTGPVTIENLNVPTCTTGEVRGLAEVPAQLGGDVLAALGRGDCGSKVPLAGLHDDVAAFLAGYATLDQIPNTA